MGIEVAWDILRLSMCNDKSH